ncbi:MAG: hypothetical protein EAZ97_12025 [Bacteroidetes bacterium]|nr:MAG: hypothetical protein EAZ97_12025 [Bacteroidota bacterium]
MNKLGKLCVAFLQKEGYRPEITTQEDVVFKVEGRTFIVDIDQNDDRFLRILLPNFYEIESDQEMLKSLAVANEINKNVKVGKIIIMDNNHAWAFAEQFIDDTPDLEDFFQRTIKVIRKASEDFTEKLLGSNLGILQKILKS